MSTFTLSGTRVRLSSIAAACVAMGMLGACSDSKSVSSASSGASATTAAPTTTAAPATVPETAAATTVAGDIVAPTAPPPPTCADSTAPSGAAQNLTVVDGDWNGDGSADTGVSWAEPSGGGVVWFVRAEVSGGLSSTVALGDLGVGFARVLDGVDVDFALGAEPGTNRDEILGVVGGGASGVNLGIFGVGADGCLFQFDDGAGAPFRAPIAASIGQMSGLMCDGAGGSQFLVVLRASTVDDLNWDTTDYRVNREGDHSLVLGAALSGTLLTTDATLGRYARAECGGDVLVG